MAVINTDVLVIGGGVIGLSIAREMHKSGAGHITLIEQGVCGREASWAAAGMLSPQAEVTERGVFYDVCSRSRDLYPEFAAGLLSETGVDIELDRTGTLCLAFTDGDVREIRERIACQQSAGLELEHLTAAEVRRAEPFVSPAVGEGLYFAGDWQVDNRKLCEALVRYARTAGIDIRENTRALRIAAASGRVTGVETDTDTITAGLTVLATGAWTSLIQLGDAAFPVNIEPVRGQIVAFKTAKRLFRHVIYSGRGYLVPRSDGRLLAGSTSEAAGFDRSTTSSAMQDLCKMASEIAPAMAGMQPADHWAGLRPKALDALPVIGTLDGFESLFVAAAHYRNGILLAPITARLAAGHLSGESVAAAFSPDRFRLRIARIGN